MASTQSQTKLDSGIELQRTELTGVLGGTDEEEIEVLGRAMMYGVGDVLVPRDWLLQRCRDLDIPERIIPKQPSWHSAYKRAQNRLITSNPDEGERTDVYAVNVDGAPKALKVELDLKSGSGNVNHLMADVFWPEYITGEEGGRWDHHELGTFNYDTDAQKTKARIGNDCPEALAAVWSRVSSRAHDLHKKMRDHHTGDDIRHMVYYLKSKHTDTIVPLRDAGAVYFVPEGPLSGIIESLATIFSEINQMKSGGKRVEIRTIEVVDSEEKREWIAQRVEQTLEEMVDDVIEEAFEAMDEGDDTVDEIVDAIVQRVGEGEETANQYNQLLQAKLDVEQLLSQRAQEVDEDEKEELIRSAMEEADL